MQFRSHLFDPSQLDIPMGPLNHIGLDLHCHGRRPRDFPDPHPKVTESVAPGPISFRACRSCTNNFQSDARSKIVLERTIGNSNTQLRRRHPVAGGGWQFGLGRANPVSSGGTVGPGTWQSYSMVSDKVPLCHARRLRLANKSDPAPAPVIGLVTGSL